MGKPDVRKRACSIMARIQAVTARHDPSYRLKKRGILNAHDMRRLIPAHEELMQDVKVVKDPFLGKKILSDIEKSYILNDVINTTDLVKHIRG